MNWPFVQRVIIMSLLLCGLLLRQTFAASERPMTAAKQPDTEATVCGTFREPFMFWLWHRMAGAADPQALVNIPGLERLTFNTRDGITLAGYKLAAVNPTAYLLVAQGNAMLADQLIADLQTFRDRGWDVYIYDYRGYGNSQGKSRLAAIVDDYGEIVAHLNTQGYKQRLLYGISMGGVILLNAVGKTDLYTRLVVDSSPARISNLGCPEQYDPVDPFAERWRAGDDNFRRDGIVLSRLTKWRNYSVAPGHVALGFSRTQNSLTPIRIPRWRSTAAGNVK